jgi:hypothetical protein
METIAKISTPPADGAAFDEWLSATDGSDFLKRNSGDDESWRRRERRARRPIFIEAIWWRRRESNPKQRVFLTC